MLKTITIDIINEKALKLLQDLEQMQLIHMQHDNTRSESQPDWKVKYKGAMQKQSLNEVDNQLNDLRSEWE